MQYIFYIGVSAIFIIFILLTIILFNKYMVSLVDKRIAVYQNDLVKKHCDEVQNIYKQMRGWRHDYHNHIQTMKALNVLGKSKEINEYLGKLDKDLTSVDTVLKTGNVMVDAILNSKISLVKSNKISIKAKATVPNGLLISEIDLCVIIGNILDNALEACQKISDVRKRFIRIYIGIYKKSFYISVQNSSGGEVKKIGRAYLSTKDSPSHGFGLIRIEKIVARYDGYVNCQNEEGVFVTEIMMPIS